VLQSEAHMRCIVASAHDDHAPLNVNRFHRIGLPAGVASGLEHAPEARTHLVTGWFQTYLGRLPANGEEQGLVTMLLQGQTEEQVLSRILGSQEFFNHAQTLIASGTPQERLVQALYQLLLKRAGSPGEVAGWIKVLPQLGAQGMALDFLTSSEFRINLFTSYYNTLLHRAPDTIWSVQLDSVEPGRGHRPPRHRVVCRVLRQRLASRRMESLFGWRLAAGEKQGRTRLPKSSPVLFVFLCFPLNFFAGTPPW
jgi:hypothetical protein